MFFCLFILLAWSVFSNQSAPRRSFDEILSTVIGDSDEVDTERSWTAAPNPIFSNMSPEELHLLGNGAFEDSDTPVASPLSGGERRSLPVDFIYYDKWPECDVQPMNQYSCGSCWLCSASQTVSDRLCVEYAKQGRDMTHYVNRRLSSQNMASCFAEQHPTITSFEICNGGNIGNALKILIYDPANPPVQQRGSPVESCWEYCPYDGAIPTHPTGCKHSNNGSMAVILCDVAKVPGSCPNGASGATGWNDRMYIYNYNYLSWNEQQIKQKIYDDGPLTVRYTFYQDFYSYSSGIYQRNWPTSSGGHAVTLIGWGVEYGVNYWILKNSWGAWGEKRWTSTKGYFRFIRGTNDCGLEQVYYEPNVTATPPDCPGGCTGGQICVKPNTCGCPRGKQGGGCTTPKCHATCLNGGTCDTNAPICTCYNGWYGHDCSHFKCDSRCLNSGTCTQPNNCTCAEGWKGDHCETYYCPGVSCQNGGYCSGPNTCQCVNGWSGGDCSGFSCPSGFCLHGSTCIAPSRCDCSSLPTYEGDNCGISIDSVDITPGGGVDKEGSNIKSSALDGGQTFGVISGSLAAVSVVLFFITFCCLTCCLACVLCIGLSLTCCLGLLGLLGLTGVGGTVAYKKVFADSDGIDFHADSVNDVPLEEAREEAREKKRPKLPKPSSPPRNTLPKPKNIPAPPRKRMPPPGLPSSSRPSPPKRNDPPSAPPRRQPKPSNIPTRKKPVPEPRINNQRRNLHKKPPAPPKPVRKVFYEKKNERKPPPPPAPPRRGHGKTKPAVPSRRKAAPPPVPSRRRF